MATAKRKLIAGYNDLATRRPDIAKEWHPTKNGELQADKIAAGSNTVVWWQCSCGYEWKTPVYSRTSGRETGCPVCSGKVVVAGKNDLRTLYPGIAAQWDYEKNGVLLPSTVRPGSNKIVWWKCENGHTWRNRVIDRTRGRGCPMCAKGNRPKARAETILKEKGSLAETNPKLAKEWNYEKNIGLLPTEITQGSKKPVWWICEKGHEWSAAVYSRVAGRGCPICAGELSSSFPEQALFYYLSRATEAKNRFRIEGREVDIYLPDLKTAIEYNGRFYHRNRNQQDAEKAAFLKTQGVRLICVEEGKKESTEGDKIYYQYVNASYRNLTSVIEKLLQMLGLPAVDIDIDRDRQEIYASYMQKEKENSIAGKCPWLIEEWNYPKNGKLTPWQVPHGSHKRVWWKCCKCGHEWEAVVYSRKKHGCPACNKSPSAGKGRGEL